MVKDLLKVTGDAHWQLDLTLRDCLPTQLFSAKAFGVPGLELIFLCALAHTVLSGTLSVQGWKPQLRVLGRN